MRLPWVSGVGVGGPAVDYSLNRDKSADMRLDLLVQAELNRYDWSRILEADGPATSIPEVFRQLLAAESPEVAAACYWKLENHVFVQNSLFEAARYLVPAISAALAAPDRPKWVKIQLLEVLFHIVNGEPHKDEVARGMTDLGVQCRALAREGLWTLYRIFQEGELSRAAKDIIEIIDHEGDRLLTLDQLNRKPAG